MGATTDSTENLSIGRPAIVGSRGKVFPRQDPLNVTESPLASLKKAPQKRSLMTKQQAKGLKDSMASKRSGPSTSTPHAAVIHKEGDPVSTDSSSSTPIASNYRRSVSASPDVDLLPTTIS